MQKYVTEYRINKKGCECFRSRSLEEAHEKLKELQAKRPGVYTIQHRDCPLNKYGELYRVTPGSPANWSTWRD